MLFIQKIDLYIRSIPYGGFLYCYESESIFTSKKHNIKINKINLRKNNVYFNYKDFCYIKNLSKKDKIIFLCFMKIKKQPERALDCLSLINKKNIRHEVNNALKSYSKIHLLKKL